MANALPVSRLINVSVNLTPQAAQSQNLTDLLILGSSPVIDVVSRMRTYDSLSAVASDFGTTAPEYLAAVLWFEQQPQPTEIRIGRWAKTATAGQLVGATLSAAQQAIAAWQAITTGAFTITVDGGTVQHVTGLNFSSDTNLNGVASTINAVLTGATIAWDSNFDQFTITSNSSGTTSTVSFLTAPTSGTDISSMLGMTASSSGAYQANGIAAETAAAAVALFDQMFGRQWYAVTIPGAADADLLNVSAYIEAANTKHFHAVTTMEAGVLVPTDTSDIAYELAQLKYNKTATQFSSSNDAAATSLMGRILTTDYTANNTAITLMYKQEPGIVAESLNETQIGALEAKNCNVFVNYDNDTAIIEPGVCASGQFIDTVIGCDNLAVDIQTAVYNLLYQSTTKIPQTDAGNHLIATTIEGVLQQYVTNGFLAPGVWNSGGFGTLNQGDYLPTGYYVYAPPISTQSQADRSARKSVTFQIAAKLAGAVHTVDIQINVNQ